MSTIKLIKNDSEQKNRIILKESEIADAQEMGNTIEDYEFLSSIGKNDSSKVFKVLSKLNNKIYVMKMINIKNIQKRNNKELLRIKNEVRFLNILSHPNITKYYKNFIKEEILYILMEYVPNGDLSELIKMRKKINKPFEEEEIWKFFLQCSNGLNYIHEKGFIHRDIKAKKILLDNNMNTKIGEFSFNTKKIQKKYLDDNNKYSDGTYVLNEKDIIFDNISSIEKNRNVEQEIIDKNKSDQKIDVYELGNVFFEIVYFHSLLTKNENDKNINYPNKDKIVEIINLMIEKDKNKRATSLEIHRKIGIEYSRVCRNNNIHAMLMCLSSFNNFNNLLINEKEKYNNLDNMSIFQSYINFMQYLYDKDSNFNINIIEFKVNDFRKKLGLKNIKLEGTKEIELNFLFAFVLRKLHDETKIGKNNIIQDSYDELYLINQIKEEYETSEIEAKIKFDNLNENFDSPINKYFRGLIKQINICSICKNKTYQFSCFFFANFNFNKIEIKESNTAINLEEIFKMKNKLENIIFCNNCIKKTKHDCEKEYLSFPNLLVINIYQSSKSKKKEIYIKENIELRDSTDRAKKYHLVGLIRKNKQKNREGYISYFYFDYSKQWFKGERYKKFNYMDNPDGKRIDDVVMLFYILN